MNRQVKSEINRAAHEISKIAYEVFKKEITAQVETAINDDGKIDYKEIKQYVLKNHELYG